MAHDSHALLAMQAAAQVCTLVAAEFAIGIGGIDVERKAASRQKNAVAVTYCET
jgi:hypothetical protein